MKRATGISIVLVTAPDLKVARKLTAAVLKQRLAACVNLINGIESHYWWQGKLERSREVLLLIKTSGKKLEKLETLILSEHPYDTPEIVSFPLGQSTQKYFDWLTQSTAAAKG